MQISSWALGTVCHAHLVCVTVVLPSPTSGGCLLLHHPRSALGLLVLGMGSLGVIQTVLRKNKPSQVPAPL